jgi:hypothetical protein
MKEEVKHQMEEEERQLFELRERGEISEEYFRSNLQKLHRRLDRVGYQLHLESDYSGRRGPWSIL